MIGVRRGPAWAPSGGRPRRRHDAQADQFGPASLFLRALSRRARRPKFRDHTVAVGHQHGFAGGDGADIAAQSVLESFDANLAHSRQVATRGYFVNARSSTFAIRRDLRHQSLECHDFRLSGGPLSGRFAGVVTPLPDQSAPASLLLRLRRRTRRPDFGHHAIAIGHQRSSAAASTNSVSSSHQ